jgi:hypothetical protein
MTDGLDLFHVPLPISNSAVRHTFCIVGTPNVADRQVDPVRLSWV